MSIDITLVKQLRDATYASLKDCKSALEECNGDLDAAQQWLVKKGVSNAAKKADRELNDGQVKIIVTNDRLTVFKIGCETDFVAKNDMFGEMMDQVAAIIASATGTIHGIDDLDAGIKDQAQEVMNQYIAKLGENMQIIDVMAQDLNGNQAAQYIHQGGKIGAVVIYTNPQDSAETIAKQVAMHIAAMNPQYMTQEEIPSKDIEAKKAEFAEELQSAGKPEAMIAQIAEGKINKYFADLVLMNQGYIGDESTTIANLIGDSFTLVSAHRFAI